MVTGTLARIGNEVMELQRTELGELREAVGPSVVGSITMPHKRNPERSEHLDTLARLTRAHAGVMLEGDGPAPRARRPGWKAEWPTFPEVCLLTSTALGSPWTWCGPSRSTPTACARTSWTTTSSCPSRCSVPTPPGWASTRRRPSCSPAGRSPRRWSIAGRRGHHGGVVERVRSGDAETRHHGADGRACRRRRHGPCHSPARRHGRRRGRDGRGPELVDGAYTYEIRTAGALHDGLNLADMAHLLQLVTDGIVPRPAASDLAGALERADASDWTDFGYDPHFGEPYSSRERRFESELGDAAGWLPPAAPVARRPASAFRLHLRREGCELVLAAARLAAALGRRGREHRNTLFADHTYLQPAQPSTVGHYLTSFAYPVLRDGERLLRVVDWLNASPCGAGA